MLLLYDGSYREPTVPRPTKKQTNPPTLSIANLYTNNNYPTGLEMPYTVSECSIVVYSVYCNIKLKIYSSTYSIIIA